MKKILIPALVFLCACGGANIDNAIEGITAEAAEMVEEAEERVLKKDARLIGGEKSDLQLEIESAQLLIEAEIENEFIGYWVGAFGENKINIALSQVSEEGVKGHSICAGNFRPITGEVSESGENLYTFILREPGDDKYDGRFDFTIDLAANTMSGTWTPFNAAGNSNREYLLKKTPFVYDATAGQWPESSTRELTIDDVENLMEDELALMRNEIYARHGYSFKNKEFRSHFEGLDWYMPMGVDIRSQLSDIEVRNIDLIYEYESYYEDYYDDYGR